MCSQGVLAYIGVDFWASSKIWFNHHLLWQSHSQAVAKLMEEVSKAELSKGLSSRSCDVETALRRPSYWFLNIFSPTFGLKLSAAWFLLNPLLFSARVGLLPVFWPVVKRVLEETGFTEVEGLCSPRVDV